MKKVGVASIVLTLLSQACMAATPASKAYVDAQFAGIQSQIDNLAPAVTHPVGSCYGGGVVFYNNTTTGAAAGQHGLIAKLVDSTTTGCSLGNCVWASPILAVDVGTEGGYFTGQANTNIVIGLSGDKAASAAYDPTPASDCPTCTNWYLPSQYELYSLYAQASLNGSAFWTTCGGAAPSTLLPYWTSSQVLQNLNAAWYVNFDDGDAGLANTTGALKVRAVRAF